MLSGAFHEPEVAFVQKWATGGLVEPSTTRCGVLNAFAYGRHVQELEAELIWAKDVLYNLAMAGVVSGQECDAQDVMEDLRRSVVLAVWCCVSKGNKIMKHMAQKPTGQQTIIGD